MVFPEGTRSKEGKVNRFKEGAFRIAHEMKADILPMVLDGTSGAIPKSGWSLRGKQKIILKVIDPVSYNEFHKLSIRETRDKFQDMISDEIMKIRTHKN